MPPLPESPRCLRPFQGNLFSLHFLDFQAEDRLTPRWHVGQPCGKPSRESHRSLDPREGKRDTAATAREERARAGPHSRRRLTPLGRLRSTPRSMSALQRNPQVPAPTAHKVFGPRIDGRGIPRGPQGTPTGLAFPEATTAGPCGPHRKFRSPCCNSRKSRRFSPPGEMRPISAEASRG